MEQVRGRAQSAIDQANQLFQGRRSDYATHVDALVHFMQSRFLSLQVSTCTFMRHARFGIANWHTPQLVPFKSNASNEVPIRSSCGTWQWHAST